jgi:hypothetical protein
MELDLKDWGIIVSITLSTSSFLILLWKDFLRGPKLISQINSVIQIKLPEGNKDEIAKQLFLEDIQSNRPTEFSKYIIEQSEEIRISLEQKNQDGLLAALGKYINSTGQTLIYDPDDDDLRKKIGTPIFNPFFYIPLQILNKGRKTGEISTLMLKITNENRSKKWVYGCTHEVETDKFKTLNHKTKTGHLIGDILPSITISAQSDKRVDPIFFPVNEAHDTIVSLEGIGLGTYFIKVIGYNSEDKKCLETKEQKLIINEISFFDAYRGVTVMRQLFMETHIKKEIKNHNSK